MPASQLVIATTGPHQKVSLSITKPCATDHKIVLLIVICDEVAATIETGNIPAIEVSLPEDGDVGMPASNMEIGSSDADGGHDAGVCKWKQTNFLLSYLRLLYNFCFLFHVYHIHCIVKYIYACRVVLVNH